MGATIDLNADLGEGYGPWRMGDDEALLEIVTSATIACGFHAGDPSIMRRLCGIAVERGVRIGAHVGYHDLRGFGRRRIDIGRDELSNDVIYQLGALQAIARAEGGTVAYVKPHGALSNACDTDKEHAAAVLDAVATIPGMAVMVLPGSELERAARGADIRTIAEAFPDRGYESTGLLRSRRLPDAIVDDVDQVVRRAVSLAIDGEVMSATGERVPINPDSICLHGDNPRAVDAARLVRAALAEAGVELSATG